MELWHWLVATEFWDLMHDLNHIAFELSWEVITALLLWPVAKWKAKREIAKHDAQHHHGHEEIHYNYGPLKITGPNLTREEPSAKDDGSSQGADRNEYFTRYFVDEEG